MPKAESNMKYHNLFDSRTNEYASLLFFLQSKEQRLLQIEAEAGFQVEESFNKMSLPVPF